MAYSKLYERINFVNESEGKTTPLGAVNMNKLDYAVDALDDRVVELDKNKLEKSSIDSLVADISYEKDSGELTVSRVNSPSKKIDLGTSEILEKVNDVSKEVEDLNKKTDEIIENIGIKNTARGETIHVIDSADSKVLEFGLHGKAEQNGTPTPDAPVDIEIAGASYNLLENTATSQTINGVEFAVNDDGSITVNGTASPSAYMMFSTPLGELGLEDGTKYVYSGAVGGSTSTYDLGIENLGSVADGEKEFTYQASSMNNYKVYLRVFNGATVNTTFYPMIRKASVKNDRYMPYGVGSVEVKSVGKNQLDISEITSGYPDATSGASIDDIVASTRYAHSEPIEISEPVTIQWKANSGLDYIRYFLYKDGIYQSQKNLVHTSDGTHTIPKSDSYDTMLLVVGTTSAIGTWDNSYLVDCQIEYGTTATPFEAFKSTTSLISTPNGLASVGGVYDEIIKYADGSGKRIQRIGKAVLDENSVTSREAFDSNGNGGRINLTQLTNFKSYTGSKATILCSHYQSISGDSAYLHTEGIVILSNGVIRVWDSRYTEGIEEYKTWIASNNVTVWYELADPIITDLTAEEIAEIEKLHTFYPVTNISNDANCNMTVKYLADAKNYIDNRLALIETAMINNI